MTEEPEDPEQQSGTLHRSLFLRLLNAVLNGGKSGVEIRCRVG